jgi:ATP synthase protein I
MTKPETPPSLKDLDSRLKVARNERRETRPKKGRKAGGIDASGMATGMRIAVEIVAAIAVGVGVGLVLDYWLGTKPWLMVLFLLIGTGAAFVNVMRAAKEIEERAKEAKRKAAETPPSETEEG